MEAIPSADPEGLIRMEPSWKPLTIIHPGWQNFCKNWNLA
jgi:hypothetical protein